ncbi:MAG: LysR family transcriptional regulator [Chloroflexi bacterium]|nr:LysR family transcriptional regulator [Chloroflexota bacterium]
MLGCAERSRAATGGVTSHSRARWRGLEVDTSHLPLGARTAGPVEPLRPRSKIWLERGGAVVLSDWRLELLEAIDETGSLARAAIKLDVPYRTAWAKLRELEAQLAVKLLETHSGGSDGGGSRLTDEAQRLIARFRRVSAGVAQLVEQRFRLEFPEWFD